MIEIGNREKPKILIVDDETEILESLADLLRKDFYIFATSDIDEARNLLASHNMISLVISDQRMPGLSGAELLAETAKTNPDTARILLTGYADIEAVIEAVNQGQIVQYITKPWNPINLLGVLKPIAARHELRIENRRLIQEMAKLNTSVADSQSRMREMEKTQSFIAYENETLKTAYDELKNSYWHLRKIQEILPICMSCGKVKTAESKWEDVVDFLKKNSLFLSHGYCPACEDKIMKISG
jgi:response regulator RpfG family c-di-GMP phosphodiesterase